MSAKTDLTLTRGDSFSLSLEFRDATNDAAMDVSGWTLRFTAKLHPSLDDSQAVLKADIVLDSEASGGLFNLVFEPADTLALEPVSYAYDVKIESPDGFVEAVLCGTLRVEQTVTQRYGAIS